jgi:hypothetical protein
MTRKRDTPRFGCIWYKRYNDVPPDQLNTALEMIEFVFANATAEAAASALPKKTRPDCHSRLLLFEGRVMPF